MFYNLVAISSSRTVYIFVLLGKMWAEIFIQLSEMGKSQQIEGMELHVFLGFFWMTILKLGLYAYDDISPPVVI